MSGVNICYCIDENHLKYVIISIRSAYYHNPNINIFIICNNTAYDRRQEILNEFPDIKFICISDNKYKKFPTLMQITTACFFRFEIANVIDVDKIIYLDSDIIINGDISELYNIDLENNVVGGVTTTNPAVKNHGLNLLKIKHQYINSGVLLIDVKKFKNYYDQLYSFAKNNKYLIKYQDQDTLNVVLDGKIKVLSNNWNFPNHENSESELLTFKNSLIHFAGLKPWGNDEQKVPLIKYWQKFESKIDKKETPVICYCADSKYIDVLLVSLNSLFKYNKNVKVNVLLDEEAYLEKNRILNKFNSVNCIEIKNIYKTMFQCRSHGTFYRLSISEFINDDKIIYLDCDTIINGDISKLYNIDLGNNVVGGVNDPWDGLEEYANSIGLNYKNYINAGVLLINLKQWKLEDLSNKLLTWLKNNLHRIKLADQDAINSVLKNRIKLLPEQWNIIGLNKNKDELLKLENKIVHFPGMEGGNGPWFLQTCPEYMRKIWYDGQKELNNKINICYCLNNNVINQLNNSLESLFEYNDIDNLNIYIISQDNEELDIEQIKFNNYLNFRQIKKTNLPTAYLRIFLPNDLNKVIYLDCDTIIEADLTELYNIDLGDKLIAGVLDYNMNSCRKFDLDYYQYINTGVLILDLEKLRNFNFKDKCLEFIKSFKEDLVYNDQDVINFVLKDNIFILEDKWNITPNPIKIKSLPIERKKIIHYAGSKPDDPSKCPLQMIEIWNKYNSKSIMNVCYCCDEGYLEVTATSIVSLLENNRNVKLFLLLNDKAFSKKSILETVIKKYKVDYVIKQIDDIFKTMFDCRTTGIFYRLLIPIEFNDTSKILYLDGDVMIKGNISELYNTELGDNALAAVRDHWKGIHVHAKQVIENVEDYVNSGVLLMNLDYWRKNNISSVLLAYMQKYVNRLGYPDQDAINNILNDKIIRINQKWNMFPHIEDSYNLYNSNKDLIIHWTAAKPWGNSKVECPEYLKSEWERYRSLW